MRHAILTIGALICAFTLGQLSAQDVEPSCDMCPATYVPAEEIAEYAFVGRKAGLVDQLACWRVVNLKRSASIVSQNTAHKAMLRMLHLRNNVRTVV